MRAALDCRSVFRGMGGIGRCAERLAATLPRLAPDDEFLLLFTRRDKETPAEDGGSLRIECDAAMIDPVWEQVHLPTLLREQGVDLYHNPCFSIPAVQTARRVATVHDVVFKTRPDLVEAGLRAYLDQWTGHALGAADAVITVSEYSKDAIVDAYGADTGNVHVVYNGVDGRFRPMDRSSEPVREAAKRLGLPERYALYVGTLEPKKNIPRLVEAFSKAARSSELKDFGLVLAGSAPAGERWARDLCADAGIADRTRFLGYVEDSDVAPLMAAADLFVYPSLYEGFGLPPLEAMACGAPTLVSDATCLPEIVGDGALVAPAEDTEALADAIARVATDRDLAEELVRRGRERAAAFTWEKTARATLEVYRKAVRERE